MRAQAVKMWAHAHACVIRAQVPLHILDALFFVSTGKTSNDLSDSASAEKMLGDLRKAVMQGVAEKVIQVTPHVVVLDPSYYHQMLKPLFARWVLAFFSDKGLANLTHDQLLDYVLAGGRAGDETVAAVGRHCKDDAMKLLNLAHEWISSVLPHVLGKVNRVSYGLLDDAMLQRAHGATLSRKLLCVPFVGKDVPSPASEFSHPEVVIGLTVLGYRYEGLRLADWRTLVKENRDMLKHEVGPVSERPTSLRWKRWVEIAGGRVRGRKKKKGAAAAPSGAGDTEVVRGVDTRLLPNKFIPDPHILAPVAGAGAERDLGTIDADVLDSIWPIHLVDANDKEQEHVLFTLLGRLPQVISWYLENHVLPLTMRFQPLKLSASGQELGGDLIFRSRLGFSGTPSDLLPVEFGSCVFEEGDDGKILSTLTSPEVVQLDCLPCGWSVQGLLRRIAGASPCYHALIDSGALITGLNNYSVARKLLEYGLQGFDACIYLDAQDRKMALLRNGWTTLRLDQCGTPLHRRFSFYDHCHTTGMDIKQFYTARAALTLGKDMTFRDLAQGAYRMRGIGQGQTITFMVIPEMAQLVHDCLAAAGNTNGAVVQSGRTARSLEDIAAWLIVNGLKSEQTQADMLLMQNLDNIPRKFAYRQLLQEARDGRVGSKGSKDPKTPALLRAWALKVNLDVANDVPVSQSLMEVANLKIADAETGGLLHDEDCMLAHQIFAKAFGDPDKANLEQSVDHANAFEAEQVQEQEQEQEQVCARASTHVLQARVHAQMSKVAQSSNVAQFHLSSAVHRHFVRLNRCLARCHSITRAHPLCLLRARACTLAFRVLAGTRAGARAGDGD